MNKIIFYLKLLFIGIWIVITTVLFLPFALIFRGNLNLSYWYFRLFIPLSRAILGIRIVPVGTDDTRPFQPCIYVMNHQSALDFLIFPSLKYERAVTIGKKEFLWIPLFGWIYALTGNFLINRQSKTQSIHVLQKVAAKMKRDKISVGVFPEGTRNKTGEDTFLPFKKGAFHLAIDTQFPLLPLVASPVSEVMNVKEGWIKGGEIRVKVMEPIPTAGLTGADVGRICDETREKMLAVYEDLKRKPQ